MSAETAAVALIIIAAPAATLFPFVYGWVARGVWWHNPTGRALMASSVGLALLIDIALIYKAFGDDYALRDAVRLSVYALIALGAWLKLGALLYEWAKSRETHH